MIQRYRNDQWEEFLQSLDQHLTDSPDLAKTNIFLGKPINGADQLQSITDIIASHRSHIEYVRLFGSDWLEVDRKKISAYQDDYQCIVYEGLLYRVYTGLDTVFKTEYRPQSQWWLWHCTLNDAHIEKQLIRA